MFKKLFLHPIVEKKSYLVSFFLGLILMSVAQGMMILLLGPLLKGLFLNNSVEHISLKDIFPTKGFVDFENVSFSRDSLIQGVPILLVLLGALKSLGNYTYQLGVSGINLFVAMNFRNRLFESILKQSYLNITSKSPGQWMSILMNDVLYLQNRLSDVLNSAVKDTVTVIASFVALWIVDPVFSLMLLVCAPVVGVGMGRTGKKIANFSTNTQGIQGDFAKIFLDIRKRFTFIKAQGGEKREEGIFQKFNQSYFENVRKSFFVRVAFAPTMEVLGFFVFALVLYILKDEALANPTHILVFLGALGSLLRPFRNIGEQFVRFQETKGALTESLKHISFQSFPDIQHEKQRSISINKIQLGYSESCVFDFTGQLNFQSGKSYALIGPSGSGKSTFLKCLSGIIYPLHWEASVPYEHIFGQSALVSQTPFFFSGTILENLEYGIKNVTPSLDIENSLQLSCVDFEVSQFQHGLLTHYSSLNQTISGGQLQRLVIARALLQNKPTLLLDEATSSVDHDTDHRLIENLLAWCRRESKLLIAVTHRLSSLANFDCIYFIEGGEIQFQGHHHDLMKEARYRSFYEASL